MGARVVVAAEALTSSRHRQRLSIVSFALIAGIPDADVDRPLTWPLAAYAERRDEPASGSGCRGWRSHPSRDRLREPGSCRFQPLGQPGSGHSPIAARFQAHASRPRDTGRPKQAPHSGEARSRRHSQAMHPDTRHRSTGRHPPSRLGSLVRSPHGICRLLGITGVRCRRASCGPSTCPTSASTTAPSQGTLIINASVVDADHQGLLHLVPSQVPDPDDEARRCVSRQRRPVDRRRQHRRVQLPVCRRGRAAALVHARLRARHRCGHHRESVHPARPADRSSVECGLRQSLRHPARHGLSGRRPSVGVQLHRLGMGRKLDWLTGLPALFQQWPLTINCLTASPAGANSEVAVGRRGSA